MDGMNARKPNAEYPRNRIPCGYKMPCKECVVMDMEAGRVLVPERVVQMIEFVTKENGVLFSEYTGRCLECGAEYATEKRRC